MKVTYLSHSGFLLELEKTLLLFDYYKGDIPALPDSKRLFVFVSHRHHDHFNPAIFELAGQKPDTKYILSGDIWLKRAPAHLQEQTVRLKRGIRWEQDNLIVETLKSTDKGAAFLVEAEGKTIYHAGDLNDWRWDEESEEWNRQMAEKFHKFIEPLRGKEIDAAFIPLDPRQEGNYTLGMDYFLDIANAEKVYPMHMWDDYSVIDRWLSEHKNHPGRGSIVKITYPGETFEQ